MLLRATNLDLPHFGVAWEIQGLSNETRASIGVQNDPATCQRHCQVKSFGQAVSNLCTIVLARDFGNVHGIGVDDPPTVIADADMSILPQEQ
jgi:hypothetical protein